MRKKRDAIRLNKEYAIDVCDGISLKYGTVNKVCPSVIYVNARMWLCPMYDGTYDDILQVLYGAFKCELRRRLRGSAVFGERFILDFGIKSDNLVEGKRKFFEIQLFLRQRGLREVKSLRGDVLSDIAPVFLSLERGLKDNSFDVNKRKS